MEMNTGTIMKTKSRSKKTIPLTDAEKEILLWAMRRLWQQIGGDAEEACAQGGVPLRNGDAAEFVLDAQRLEEVAGREKDQPLLAALSKFRTLDWKAQVRFLTSRYTMA